MWHAMPVGDVRCRYATRRMTFAYIPVRRIHDVVLQRLNASAYGSERGRND